MNNFYTFPKSILEDALEPIDSYAPVSFLTWFNNKNFVSFNIDNIFDEYRAYITAWGTKKNRTQRETNTILRDSYIQVMRDIILNFATEEERRFVANADYTDPADLDIIIPFFIGKIKTICLYYVDKREELKTSPVVHNIKGSNLGIQNLVKKVIYDSAKTNLLDSTNSTFNFPPVSAIARDLSIYVEELYDLNDSYFNRNPQTSTNNSYIQSLQQAGDFDVNSKLYLQFKEAVVDAINEYPFFIESLGSNNFAINVRLSGVEYNYLKERDFIEYLSGGEADLKLNLFKRLAPKYIGTDFYYLSTDSTGTKYVSGILFSVGSLSGAPTPNLLNKQFPTVATIPSLSSLYTEFEVGRFFTPNNQGILIYNTPEKTFNLDYSKLLPNKVYAFPDPNVVGNTVYNSNSDNFLSPLTYFIDVTRSKYSRSNQFAFGNVLSNSYNQLFYGYQSKTQDIQLDTTGLNRTVDNIQFWSGAEQQIWSDSKVWPDLSKTENLNYESRQDALLVDGATPVYWGSDIFGNEYGLLKNVFSLPSVSGIENDEGYLNNSNSIVLTSVQAEFTNIFDKKYRLPGRLYFRNHYTNIVSPVSSALSAIFIKYPEIVVDEIYNSPVYFNMYFDTFVIETTNYVVIDSVNYDFDTNKVINNNNPGTYFSKYKSDSKIETFLGEWYSESEEKLFLVFLRILPSLSGSNFRAVYPQIFKSSLTYLKFEQIYPAPGFDTFNHYSLSGGFAEPPQIDIFKLEGVSVSRLEKNNLFNLAYLVKNLNGIPFIVNEQIGKSDPYYISYSPKLFKPFYFIYDNNYGNPVLSDLVQYTKSKTGIVGMHNREESVFDTGRESTEFTNYMFCDGIAPIQINSPGVYNINFDWQSYNTATVYVGCSGFQLRVVDDILLWNAGTNMVKALTGFDQVIEGDRFSTLYTSVSPSPYFSLSPVLTGRLKLVGLSSVGGSRFVTVETLTAAAYDEDGVYDIYELDYGDFQTLALQFGLSSTRYPVVTSYPVEETTNLVYYELLSAVEVSYEQDTLVYFYLYSDLYFKYVDNILLLNRRTYPQASVVTFTLSSSVDKPYNVCTYPDSIYNELLVTKSGQGSGTVIADPYCIDCGEVCSETFARGTTITLIASANYFSEFSRWETATSVVQDPDITLSLTDATSITAFFNKINLNYVSIEYPYVPLGAIGPRVVSQDGYIDCPDRCFKWYIPTAQVTLSCVNPLSGFVFFGLSGGPCSTRDDDNDSICSFAAAQNYNISALYIRNYDHLVSISVERASNSNITLSAGGVISLESGSPDNKINCPTTCSAYFSSTNSTYWGGSIVTLSAAPYRGYSLREWYVPSVSSINGLSADTVSFFITNETPVSAIFDVGYYTLTLRFSGGGVGNIRNFFEPTNINCGGNSPTYNPIISGCEFKVLSGSTIFLEASAYTGNTLIGLISGNSSISIGSTTCSAYMVDDFNLVAVITPSTFYTLEIVISGSSCGRVVSIPFGIDCTTSGGCIYSFPAGTLVSLSAIQTTTCLVTAFTGQGVLYPYNRGDGVLIFQDDNQDAIIDVGQEFALINEGLLLDDGGAPYGTGTGTTLTESPLVYVPMTQNRSITAIFVNA